jgi:hypothetical protein
LIKPRVEALIPNVKNRKDYNEKQSIREFGSH